MSLSRRLGALVRSAVRSPAARRAARDLTRSAVAAVRSGARGAGDKGSHTDDAADRREDPSQRHNPRSAGSDGDAGQVSTAQALADRRSTPPPVISYAPRSDDDPDPGEVVWGWVPFEEDITRGKDRPVLVLAEEDARIGGDDGEGEVLVALMLTSRDRTRPGGVGTDEHGNTWVVIGSGSWDAQGRPSEVRVDRLLRLRPSAVRREGGRLDHDRFDQVAQAASAVHGWGDGSHASR